MSAEVAGNAQQWRTGLSYRRELLPDHGMLFVFNDVLPLAFNARKTFIPLSVAFIDNDGTIGEIYSLDRRDVSKRTVLPVKHYQLALEVSAGWFDSNSIGEGCMITGHAEWLMNAVVNQIR